MATTLKADYTNQGFMIAFVSEGIKFYASVHTEMFYSPNDQNDGLGFKTGVLTPTGKYLVYLLHPEGGSIQFQICKDFIQNGEEIHEKWVDETEHMRTLEIELLRKYIESGSKVEDKPSITPAPYIDPDIINIIGKEIDRRNSENIPNSSISTVYELEASVSSPLPVFVSVKR